MSKDNSTIYFLEVEVLINSIPGCLTLYNSQYYTYGILKVSHLDFNQKMVETDYLNHQIYLNFKILWTIYEILYGHTINTDFVL